ncbi:hypothetical protein BU25DRAFT_461383 [Macroventuria anomochaeta]|uniref:Uncharacterized protein n=1 Tax=Macroventuria anomochaeta TaxID=301207 RepID=A0ACB6RQY6_9PLEO|nr:uncharacterized protein BU25DRAFT_461383 [Macroventuria anomochaeta]KAF2624199.1 hypothetical protein BU25DRAFT_461383 [Macroventuria anomochaeta]
MRLELYFLRRHTVVHRRYCNILEFLEHVKRWRALPNPTKVLDYDGGKIPWKHIVGRLGKFEVDFRKLDGGLYEELRACENYNDLTAKLFEIQQLQKSGALEKRFKKWKEQGDRMLHNKLKAETSSKFTVGLNNKRFSHKHPLGIDANDLEAEKLTQATQNVAPKSNVASQDQKQLEEQAEPKKKWVRGCLDTVKRWC